MDINTISMPLEMCSKCNEVLIYPKKNNVAAMPRAIMTSRIFAWDSIAIKQLFVYYMYCYRKFAIRQDGKCSKSSIFQVMELHNCTFCTLSLYFCLMKRHVPAFLPV